MPQAPRFSGVFIGEGTLLVRCADAFAAHGHAVRAVVSGEPLIGQWAAEHGVTLLPPTADLAAALGGEPFDFLFSVANLRVLPDPVLALPQRMAINFHDALLPRYAGLNATSWAILNRERVHGVTWHEMVGRVDAGAILGQESIEVADSETAVSLNAKCYEAGIRLFARLVAELTAGTLAPRRPQLEARTYYSRYHRPEAAAVIDWRRPAEEIDALCRALTFGPAPNPLGLPKIDLGDAVVIPAEVSVLGWCSGEAPGRVTGVGEDFVRVATGSADVEVRGLRTIDGQPCAAGDVVGRLGAGRAFRLAA
jgi:methionyl-tRNA formyltransferase